jgi:uncharacterized membrane protein
MTSKASITVLAPRQEIERLWRERSYRSDYIDGLGASVRFLDAPGERGTEIHVELENHVVGGKLGEAVQKLRGTEPLAKTKDELRRFKQCVETGVIARSDAVPSGESLERKLGQRPAQPLEAAEREKAGV